MKKINTYIVGIFLLVACITQAQQKVIDSLERELIDPTNGLSNIEVLNELSWYYAHSDIEKGLEKANTAIALAINKEDSLQLGVAYERKGLNYEKLGKDSLSLLLYKLAEDVYTHINHKKRLATLTFNKGNFYFFRSNYQKSLEQTEKVLNIFKNNKDSVKMGRTYNLIGLNHMYLGDYTSALNAFQKGLLLFEQTNNHKISFYAEIQSNIGLLYEKLSEYQTALEYQNKALRIHKKNDHQHDIANTYNNIGQLYGILDQHQKALKMFNESYEIKKKAGNKYRVANALTNIGITYYSLKKFDKALNYFNRTKSIYKELKHNTNLSIVHKNIGDIYLDKKQPQKAAIHFDSAIVSAKNSEDKRATYLAKEGLAKATFATANYKKAYTIQQEALTLKESMLSNEKRDELAKLKAKYEYEKEKAILEVNFEKNKALDKAKTKQKILVRNFSIGAIIFIGLFLFYYLKQRHKKEKLKEIYNTETRISRKVHDELANDVYSIMNRIQNKSKIEQKVILEQLENVYKKTRDISYENSTINLENNYYNLELKEMLSSYQNKKVSILTKGLHEKLWLEIKDHKKIVIERVLKEVMTNMKKHSKASNVVITFKKDKKNLIITYVDDGVGLKKTGNFKRNGLQNAENRIQNINGTFTFDMNNKNGVKLKISIPV